MQYQAAVLAGCEWSVYGLCRVESFGRPATARQGDRKEEEKTGRQGLRGYYAAATLSFSSDSLGLPKMFEKNYKKTPASGKRLNLRERDF